MTENKDVVSVHKITGDRVEIGLAEFITMCNEIKAVQEVEKANIWLQDARKKLMDELEYIRQNTSQSSKPNSVVVYRRAPNGNMMVQFIEAMQQGQDGTLYITVGEPQ